ncbi:MAG: hypothetical protein IJQ77_11115 [Synergistaceae bacterium]|nr:hypothetical protein [Synergistaceae bacterium]MBR0251618.1 hypothetical protein [Synergistaceae bacterium]
MNTNQKESRNESQNEPQSRKKKSPKEPEIMMSDLLNAISESEYPAYILEAIERVQDWMNEMIQPEKEHEDESDIFRALFQFEEDNDEEEDSIHNLISRLESLREYADVIPNSDMPDGKPDTVIVSITPPDYESGLRMAIDYAAVFNRMTCKRLWIISDTFIFDDIVKYSGHVDALSEQGITMRYILVTPWGWVELPLSGNMAEKQSSLFKMWREDETKRRKKK